MSKATVFIKKSFDESVEFSKELEQGDFREFFEDEGMYLDKLVEILNKHGENEQGFTVEYKVTVTK